jgi:hypothetical protein
MDFKTCENITQYEENQEIIRQRLIRIVRKMYKPAISRIAHEIHLSPTTLNHFYKGEKRARWRVLFTIEEWVKNQERLMGLPPYIDKPNE